MYTSRPPRIVPNEVVGGRYLVSAELGCGGMSVVYRAFDRLRDREVALKLLKLSEDEPRNLLYLQQEFRAMARLHHPRLVQVFDYGVLDNGSSYFTMELLPGEDLSNHGPLPLDSVFQVLMSIADVLGFMHARGYVHRDVKPANVRLLPTEPGEALQVKLMDCGLTEKLGKDVNATVAGTLAYLAPEAWLGAPSDIRGDLYALGVLAYEITTGQLPFDASTGVRLLRTKTERPRDLRELRPNVPAEFARLVRDLLAPEPGSRPTSAMEVVSRLCEFSNIDFHHDPTPYLRTPALVGRTRELLELRSSITESYSGKVTPIVIVGPAGVGKTRLLDEALLEIGLKGSVVARVTGRGFAGRPYQAILDLVAPLLHLPSAEAALLRIGGKSALGLASAISLDDQVGRTQDPTATRRAVHLAFATFLDEISRHRTIVLALDDIHVADAASLEVLTAFIRAGTMSSVAIVATQRIGEPVCQSLAHLLSMSRSIELERMDKRQITDLIAGAFGPITVSATLVEDIERITSGNVYFIMEILRDLAARGLVERKRTRVTLPDSLNTAGLPKSLTEALERRIARVTPVALSLARIGAVASGELDLEFARFLLGVDDEAFLDAIDDLRREELIDVHSNELRIHHPRLREVLYQGMQLGERRQLHRRVAEFIQRHSEGDLLGRAAELGHHFAEAGDDRQALQYLVAAGDARYQGFAYFDAREAYRRALALLDAAPFLQRGELERKLNDRLGRISFYHDHRHGPAYLERALHYHLRHGILFAIAPLSRVIGSSMAIVFCVATTTLLNALMLRPRPLRRTLERILDAFAALTYMANCYTYSGRLQLALDASTRILPFVTSARRMPRAGYLLARGFALLSMNRFDEAASACEESLKVLKTDQLASISEHDRIHATGGALITRLWVDLTRGYARTSRWWKPLEDFVREHPTALLESWLMEVRIYSAFRQGKLAETEQAWREFVDKAAQAEVEFVLTKTKAYLAMAYLDVGRTSEAQDLADDVIRVGRALENPMLTSLGLYIRGMAMQAWEQLQDAERCMDEAAQLTAQPDVACWELHHSILLAAAAIALDRGNLDRVKELAKRVERRNANLALSHDLHCCRANRMLGRVALACSQPEEAVRRLERALELASEIDDNLERALCLHYLALALRAVNRVTDADECQSSCAQLLGELGNDYQLRRLGYAKTEHADSADSDVLSRVRRLVSDSGSNWELGSSSRNRSSDQGTSRSAISMTDSPVRDETLVAADMDDEPGQEP
ncbi:MAG TPA: protein kinase [Polyangiaceae bacterium]